MSDHPSTGAEDVGTPTGVGDMDEPIWWGHRLDRYTTRRPAAIKPLLIGLLGTSTGAVALLWHGYRRPDTSALVPLLVLAITALLVTRTAPLARRALALGAVVIVGVIAAVPLTPLGEEPLQRLGAALGVLAVLVIPIALIKAVRDRGALRVTDLAVVAGAAGLAVTGFVTPLQLTFIVLVVVGATTGVIGLGQLLAVFQDATDAAPRGLRTVGEGAAGAARRAEVIGVLSFEGAHTTDRVIRFLTLMGLATSLATFGVIVDSTAVVIGAMLVAPLMTPLMALSISLGMGWPRRSARAGLVVAAGIVLTVTLSALLAAATPVSSVLTANPQVVSRTSPNLLDLVVAMAAGAAGAYALSRPDVADALPGVAIAISLVPPLSVVGVTLQAGEMALARGALLLFATNAVAILVVGIAVFRITGVLPRDPVGGRGRRGRATVMALLASVSVVTAGLAVSGQRVLQADGELRTAQTVIGDWVAVEETAASGSAVEVSSVEVTGGVVAVALTATGTADVDVTRLAGELSDALGRPIDVVVDVTPVQRLRSAGRSD